MSKAKNDNNSGVVSKEIVEQDYGEQERALIREILSELNTLNYILDEVSKACERELKLLNA